MKQLPLLQVKNISLQLSGNAVLSSVSFDIEEGEQLAIVGPSGSGKTALLKIIADSYRSNNNIIFGKQNNQTPEILLVGQQHYFKNLSNTSTFYYQQRFNSNDSEDALKIDDVLKKITGDEDKISDTLQLLDIHHIRQTRLIQLSNGEHKRFQLAKAILQNADWILLDNPYTGLDATARKLLDKLLAKLIKKGVHILLVTSPVDIPDFITHVAVLDKGILKDKISRKEFSIKNFFPKQKLAIPQVLSNVMQATLTENHYEFSVAVKMVNTNVIYDHKKILNNINWKVNKGECWSLSGHNGSGKSTLLSLITGDNPQAFANEIYLFDRKKGSGETIWDIKRRIGYVSPELHHYFYAANTCFDVVASGLFDTIGLFKKINNKQRELIHEWMHFLQIDMFEKRLFKQLSNGEQRLILLARALVKNPPLLILDEPCQGLDDGMKQWFISLINDTCVKLKKTLIYVTHYEHEIPVCVTHSLKLEQGNIAA